MEDTATHSTALLIARIQRGDRMAREALFERCIPLLRRWASGRLPHHARDLAETQDLVQISVLRALNNLDGFESRHQGSFLAYLRTILLNTVKEELRRGQRYKKYQPTLRNSMGEPSDTVIETMLSSDLIDRYEQGLDQLTDGQREAVVLRLEFGLSYPGRPGQATYGNNPTDHQANSLATLSARRRIIVVSTRMSDDPSKKAAGRR